MNTSMAEDKRQELDRKNNERNKQSERDARAKGTR